MSYEQLHQQIEDERRRFVEIGHQVMSDGQVSVSEAQDWLVWYRERKQSLALLKREILLEVRQRRNAHKVTILQAPRGSKAALRRQQTLALAPYEDLLSGVDTLLLEGDKLEPTLKKLIADN